MTGNRTLLPRALAAFLALLLPALASPALAGVCTVPGSHATIQEAIDDPLCTTINLAVQTYAESISIPRSFMASTSLTP